MDDSSAPRSAMARGWPAVSVTTRSAVAASRAPSTTACSSSSVGPIEATDLHRGDPVERRRSPAPSRAANSTRIPSASTRRATNASTASDSRSSHWASSTHSSTDVSVAASASREARPGRPGTARPAAPSRAPGDIEGVALPVGKAGHAVEEGGEKAVQGRERIRFGLHADRPDHLEPSAATIAKSIRTVLPMPGSPPSTSAPLRRCAPGDEPSIAARSSTRSTNHADID